MNKSLATVATLAGLLAGAATALSSTAEAATPSIGSTAEDTINGLKNQGYNVQLSGTASAPLSQCTVANINTLGGGADAVGASPTAYVDVSCPTGC
ncbi:hypothetical protein FZI85_09395 [Mycobacterium sp. CBMA293]|uniref:hypothetical protein n=1 Tax=unclassified Mycolicibacterium TaxID=2636767 RepID=UPI0012DCD1F5|nr:MULTISPECIES: hypothetical protein [unclassified Mycolicibacterium]MUL46195.1 hypothetical protein [Mycolicibacterium sp. CBMA 360]MUL58755.1 hypothetical protein [Mycolicibacterium sp. CBMA 335]MUL69149.1 hypothetical protein [Mycolicibacterium sp. CBMA 311]MUL94113.1 hypothetical protein [Mycolicibacterium sp. CBMA 230]MUM05125.1 hypothetical protein [Mycolicibacterium sp. CBMA 213]